MARTAFPPMLTGWYRALLASELRGIFTNAPMAPSVLAHDSVRNAYASATGKIPKSASSDTKRRVPGPEDTCPICYECMHGESESRLTFCEECGNALHSECFEQCSFFFVSFFSVSVDMSFAFRASKGC